MINRTQAQDFVAKLWSVLKPLEQRHDGIEELYGVVSAEGVCYQVWQGRHCVRGDEVFITGGQLRAGIVTGRGLVQVVARMGYLPLDRLIAMGTSWCDAAARGNPPASCAGLYLTEQDWHATGSKRPVVRLVKPEKVWQGPEEEVFFDPPGMTWEAE